MKASSDKLLTTVIFRIAVLRITEVSLLHAIGQFCSVVGELSLEECYVTYQAKTDVILTYKLVGKSSSVRKAQLAGQLSYHLKSTRGKQGIQLCPLRACLEPLRTMSNRLSTDNTGRIFMAGTRLRIPGK